ncbi:hypothetical protein D3C87_1860280 [compost metagenome]
MLLKAAEALTTKDKSPTLLEMACHAKVGFMDARRTVSNMNRARVLVVVRTRKVPYRNRPVAEYAPRQQTEALGIQRTPLLEMFASWATPIV